MRSCAIVAAALVIAAVAIGGARADYGAINKYLISKVDSEEVEPNMAAAVGWLNSVDLLRFVTGVPIKELKDFTSLQQVIDDNTCDGSVDHVLSVNEAVLQKRHAFDLDEADRRKPTRRVDKVILKIAYDYAEKCEKVRLSEYLARKEKLDKSVADRVDIITKSVMEGERADEEKSKFYQPENLLLKYLREFSPRRLNHHVLKEALKFNAQGDPDVAHLQNIAGGITKEGDRADKIQLLVVKYLLEPCRRYVEGFGPGLFVPARRAARVFSISTDRNLRSSMNNVSYYLGWSRFAICQTITRNEQLVFRGLLKSVDRKEAKPKPAAAATPVSIELTEI